MKKLIEKSLVDFNFNNAQDLWVGRYFFLKDEICDIFTCFVCKKNKSIDQFQNQKEVCEFVISGMCYDCQKEIFNYT